MLRTSRNRNNSQYLWPFLATLFFIGCLGPSPEDIPQLVAQTKSKDRHQRSSACLELASLGPKAEKAVPNLILLLKDENNGVRSAAAYALRAIGTPQAVAALDNYKK